MKLAIIYWFTRSVGGIATRLNTFRNVAIANGDTCDILISKATSQAPRKFKERRWTYGGDTRIWIDGEAPHGSKVRETCKWLEDNYDAICFGFICPHPCPTYKEPLFLTLYEHCNLHKIGYVSDGYWHKYDDWAIKCLPYLDNVLVPCESYAAPLREIGIDVVINPFPFIPQNGEFLPKDKTPLLIWPNQWKNIKGITEFLEIVPDLPKSLTVELYSSGIRYYQLRTTESWKKAVSVDHFSHYNGEGRAIYFANVDLHEIARAYQRAWFTVSLQGMKSRNDTYKRGSYNNAEVEALYYGACPILHESTKQTKIPHDTYISVNNASEISDAVKEALESKFAICSIRRKKAREFVLNEHGGEKRYQTLIGAFKL